MLNSSSSPDRNGPLEVTPLDPPEGAVTIEAARHREEVFLQRFERNLARVESIYHPLEKRSYKLRASTLDPEVDDPYQQVVSILKESRLYDRGLLEKLPHDRATRYTIPPPGLFGRKKPRFVLAGIARSPIAELARLGGVLEPLGAEVLQAVIRRQVISDEAYHVLGVLSTVGWHPSMGGRLPRGENFAVVLVEQTPAGGWNLTHTLPKKLQNLLSVFDPEDFGEKVSRTFYRVIEHPELKTVGGEPVSIEKLLEELAVTREVLDTALKQVEQEDPRIRLLEDSKGFGYLRRYRT